MAASRRTRTTQEAPDRGVDPVNPTRRLRAHANAETLPALDAVVPGPQPEGGERPWHARTTTRLPRPSKARSATRLPASAREARPRKALAVDSVGETAVRMAGRIPLGEVPRPRGSRRVKTLEALTPLERAILLGADGRTTVRVIIADVDEPAERVFAALIHLERLGLLEF